MADSPNDLPLWVTVLGTLGAGGFGLAVYNRLTLLRDRKTTKAETTDAASIAANLTREQMAWKSMSDRLESAEKRISTLENEARESERNHSAKMEAKDLLLAQKDVLISDLKSDLALERERTTSKIAQFTHEMGELRQSEREMELAFDSAWEIILQFQNGKHESGMENVANNHIQRALAKGNKKRQQPPLKGSSEITATVTHNPPPQEGQ